MGHDTSQSLGAHAQPRPYSLDANTFAQLIAKFTTSWMGEQARYKRCVVRGCTGDHRGHPKIWRPRFIKGIS